VHSAVANVFEYLPAGHLIQASKAAEEYFPAAQSKHCVFEPTSLYFPAAHAVQVVAGEMLIKPTGHGVQPVSFVFFLYVP
jgi:hypothetical protein